ncbi:MAG: PAS domain-containing protein [Opitutaceae bacterium]
MNLTLALILGAALGCLLVAAVHAAMWSKDRERFLFLGSAAWSAGTVSFLSEAAWFSLPGSPFWLTLTGLSGVVSAVLLLAAGHALKPERVPRIWLWLVGVCIIWILTCSIGSYPAALLVVPSSVVSGFLMVRAAAVIATQRSQGGPAAIVLAGTLALWGLLIATYPLVPSPSAILDGCYLAQIIFGVVTVICTLLFILERWRGQFRKTEEQLRLSIEQAADGLFITDSNGRYVDVNRQACQLLRGSRDQIIGRTINDVLGPREPAVDPGALAEMVRGRIMRRERVLRRFDGSLVEVEVCATGLSDGRVQAIIRDDSDRKRMERALQESENRFRSLVEHLPIGVALWDQDYRYVYINPIFAELNGLSVEDHIGRTLAEVVPSASGRLQMILQQVLSTEKAIFDLEDVLEADAPTERTRSWRATFFPVHDAQDRPAGVGCCAINVTIGNPSGPPQPRS